MQIAVFGLGYVGLPLAVALSASHRVIGVDSNADRIAALRSGNDSTGEVTVEQLSAATFELSTDANSARGADIFIVTVPTPIDADNRPDLSHVEAATRSIAELLGDSDKPIIVYESTVYPGVTEDVCGPLIEQVSGLKQGIGFHLGYSPERINPGDKNHGIKNVVKVVSGNNAEVAEILREVYASASAGEPYLAASIKVAEAAKAIENAQRDINIAFVNEVAKICSSLDISMWDVLETAGTKWNFLNFQPGLVGGHCIGVDPYYLSFCAEKLGHDSKVILAGRETNDSMAHWLADQIHSLAKGNPARILILGISFKENVSDVRNSKIVDLYRSLAERGHEIVVFDPVAEAEDVKDHYQIELSDWPTEQKFDIVAAAVGHDVITGIDSQQITSILEPDGTVVDIKGIWRDRQDTFPGYWTL
ncbi:nucleotide sugar dehydrogenase [Parasphingopyxis sp. CP4]|uniref:nucleotide sugar dehydrogenase n=1 Tax=Parasphingopyxis sp. CP4 TaxID=2724527 RepID=UPI0015A4B297|nr:nucleotide sugar dehydrogenase [Parasphingopyxis sp. CP4]QLC20909.1 nucleotide sugar dehydrogenase [Parasphingopyxis sp. CP4]